MIQNRARALIQILGTLGVLGWVPGNGLKTALLVALWGLTWGHVRRGTLAVFFMCVLLFTTMDALAVRRGVFVFAQPNVWGLPIWETLMWAFFTYHFHHMIRGASPRFDVRVLPLAVLFSMCFGIFHTHLPLLIATGSVVALSLLLFHDPLDLIYAGYAVVVGTAVEYLGVARGLWHYPGSPPGGVPFWYIPMWGGIGLYMRRLGLPLDEKLSA